MTKTISKADLAQFTGSEQWYRHGINRKVLFTDGAKVVADRAGAILVLAGGQRAALPGQHRTLALRWDQVDLKAGHLAVVRRKNGVPPTHPLRGPELRALRQLRRDWPNTPYLFVSERGGPMSAGNVRKLDRTINCIQRCAKHLRQSAVPNSRATWSQSSNRDR